MNNNYKSMKYKRGDYIKYYRRDNSIRKGEITRVQDGCYFVNDGISMGTRPVDPDDVIGRGYDRYYRRAAIVLVLIVLVSPLYLVATSDIESNEPIQYEICIEKVEGLYDQINDTVGASYAHSDQPTANAQKLIDHCMENYNND